MGLGNFVKDALKKATKAGYVNGSQFPKGSYINFRTENGENVLLFTYPDKTEEVISHDMIKCATVLSMGVIEIEDNPKGGQTLIHGTKYLVVFKDNRQCVLTVGLGDSQFWVERVLF